LTTIIIVSIFAKKYNKYSLFELTIKNLNQMNKEI